MNYTASSETITIHDYIKKCNDNKVQKPYLQRKKKWSHERNVAFIRFLLKVRNAVMQFVFNKRIIDVREIWFVWDGNNRSNAILEFVKAPLTILSELIPSEYPKEIQEKLQTCSLKTIMDYFSLADFCDEHDARTWYNQMIAREIEAPFKEMVKELKRIDFLNIKLPITIFDGADDEYMVGVYTSVNQPGDPIALQDVIAAKVFNNRYEPTELTHYNSIKSYVDDYYNKTEEALELNMDGCDTATAMNLYQILFGFQMHLNKTHPRLIEMPGKCKDTCLDIMFELYRSLTMTEFQRIPDLNAFLVKIEKCIGIVADIRERVMSATINLNKECASLDTFLAKNALMMLIGYIYREYDARINDESLKQEVMRIVIYKLLCDCVEDKGEKAKYIIHNKIHHNNFKFGITTKLKDIQRHPESFVPINKNAVMELLHFVNNEQQMITNVRHKINKFQIMCMSLYYNKRVPRDYITNKKDLDHIIPISCVDSESPICINRLGNLMLIDAAINKKKGNRQLSDAFIQDNGLGYYNYPTESEYASICHKNKIVNYTKYNEMCERREQSFFKVVESLL
jgi:hypothetical protein